MKSSDIKPGKVFQNKWKGTTFRKVVEVSVSTETYPKGEFIFFSQNPGTRIVKYIQGGETYMACLKNFLAWAGKETKVKIKT